MAWEHADDANGRKSFPAYSKQGRSHKWPSSSSALQLFYRTLFDPRAFPHKQTAAPFVQVDEIAMAVLFGKVLSECMLGLHA
jgi:hypothetical protein